MKALSTEFAALALQHLFYIALCLTVRLKMSLYGNKRPIRFSDQQLHYTVYAR